MLNWFEIDVYMPLSADLFSDEEQNEIDKIKLASAGINDAYEIAKAYYNLAQNSITALNPKCFIPKGKTNKKYYTEIIFTNGDYALAVGKSIDVYEKIKEYVLTLPELETTE